MSDSSNLSGGQSRTSALGLLERARQLARQVRPSPSDCTIESTALRGGDKGDKGEKPPSAPQEQALPAVPGQIVQSDDPEVAWRARAMGSQIRPGFPIPFLVAQDDPIREGACLSCSIPLGDGERYRCAACLEAAILVLASLGGPSSMDGTPR